MWRWLLTHLHNFSKFDCRQKTLLIQIKMSFREQQTDATLEYYFIYSNTHGRCVSQSYRMQKQLYWPFGFIYFCGVECVLWVRGVAICPNLLEPKLYTCTEMNKMVITISTFAYVEVWLVFKLVLYQNFHVSHLTFHVTDAEKFVYHLYVLHILMLHLALCHRNNSLESRSLLHLSGSDNKKLDIISGYFDI